MRILLAGATGVIGRQTVPVLTGAGHQVIGLANAPARLPGAEVVAADALDPAAVAKAVRAADPDVIVHMLTAIPDPIDPRHLARDMALTNRLRTQGTANLLAAAGGARMIAQGVAYAYDPAGSPVKDEDAPLWRDPPAQFAPVLEALRAMEHQVGAAGGLVLRLGQLYGPGSSYGRDGGFTRQLRAGKVPVVGDGGAMFSFTHAHDAATAILAAVEHPAASGVLQRRRRPADPGPRLAPGDGGHARRPRPPSCPGLAGPAVRRWLGCGLHDRPGRRLQPSRPRTAGLEAHLQRLAGRPGRRAPGRMSQPPAHDPPAEPPAHYEILVDGVLDSRWSSWFEDLQVISGEARQTVITGPVVDQAALHGLLAKIRDLNLPLLSVRRIRPGDPSHEVGA